MKKRRKNIALFGLSANPVTDRGGHGEIVKALLAMERIKTNGDDDDETRQIVRRSVGRAGVQTRV